MQKIKSQIQIHARRGRPTCLPSSTTCLPSIFAILLLIGNVNALPVGDPRTPDLDALSKMDVPIKQGKHELSLHTFMGASKINYPDVGGTLWSPGFGAEFSYNFFFHPRWSFLIGGGIHLFNNRGTEARPDFSSDEPSRGYIEGFNDYEIGNDKEALGGEPVYLFYNVEGYMETQWSLMFMLPVMFQYQSNETRNKAFYYAVGVKIGFPFSGAYESSAERMSLCGYYPGRRGGEKPGEDFKFNDCNQAGGAGFGDGYEDIGFGDYNGVTSYQKLKLGTAFFGATEFGVKWRIYNKLAVYTGFWFDLALNDAASGLVNPKQPFTWTPKQGLSEVDENGKPLPNGEIVFSSQKVGRAVPMSLGFTVRFAFGAGGDDLLDTTRWIREIHYRDSLLALCEARNAQLAADSARAADSIAMLKLMNNDLLDSLLHCKEACKDAHTSREAIQRHLDSLDAARMAALEAARLAALEQARLDSLARLAQLEKDKAARLEAFRDKLRSLSNGLDDYKITQTIPSDNAKEKLDIAAELMRDYPDLKVRFTGHTCDKGTHQSNLRFGIQRAESARNYLVAKGIDQNRIQVETKAELDPVVPNTSENNRRKNRRVQIEILEGVENIEMEIKK